jgi:hypothetical protein
MALKHCPQCNQRVPGFASTCPHCGAAMPKAPQGEEEPSAPQEQQERRGASPADWLRRNMLGAVALIIIGTIWLIFEMERAVPGSQLPTIPVLLISAGAAWYLAVRFGLGR